MLVMFIDKKYKENEIRKVIETNEGNKKFKDENEIPDNANMCICTNITVKEMLIECKWGVFIWKINDIVYLCGTNENVGIKKTRIPINSIKFYTRRGEVKNISKTEGGDIKIGRAILGGIVGVVIGWIVGSFMDTYSDVSNFRIFTHSSVFTTILTIIGLLVGLLLAGKGKVITTNKEIDNRKTYLNYLEDAYNKQIIFDSSAYEILFELIPEKDMDYVGGNKIIESNNTQKSTNNDIYKDIEKLGDLKDKGILTEEEFNQKKQVLLDRI